MVLDFVGLMSVCLLLLYFSQNFLKEPFVNICNLSATHCVRSSWRVSHYSGRIFTTRHRDVNICVFWNKVKKKRGLVIHIVFPRRHQPAKKEELLLLIWAILVKLHMLKCIKEKWKLCCSAKTGKYFKAGSLTGQQQDSRVLELDIENEAANECGSD